MPPIITMLLIKSKNAATFIRPPSAIDSGLQDKDQKPVASMKRKSACSVTPNRSCWTREGHNTQEWRDLAAGS